jgi:deoxycytidylate deaminase
MFVAQLASFRSKDPEKEVGACIVDKNGKIIKRIYKVTLI